jgi:hypothetical protein
MGTRAKFPSLDPDELLATVSYLPLGGDADGLGDGIVPWRVGIMVSHHCYYYNYSDKLVLVLLLC